MKEHTGHRASKLSVHILLTPYVCVLALRVRNSVSGVRKYVLNFALWLQREKLLDVSLYLRGVQRSLTEIIFVDYQTSFSTKDEANQQLALSRR